MKGVAVSTTVRDNEPLHRHLLILYFRFVNVSLGRTLGGGFLLAGLPYLSWGRCVLPGAGSVGIEVSGEVEVGVSLWGKLACSC